MHSFLPEDVQEEQEEIKMEDPPDDVSVKSSKSNKSKKSNKSSKSLRELKIQPNNTLATFTLRTNAYGCFARGKVIDFNV